MYPNILFSFFLCVLLSEYIKNDEKKMRKYLVVAQRDGSDQRWGVAVRSLKKGEGT